MLGYDRALSVSLCFFAMLIMVFAIRSFFSDLYYVALNNEVEHFELSRKSLDKAEELSQLENLRSLSEDLSQFNTASPDVYSLLSYVDLLNFGSKASNEERKEFLKKSVTYNKKALEQRPLYSDYYVQNAYIQLQLSKGFDQVNTSLKRAQVLGPYEPSTARAGIDILFTYWQKLSIEQKKQALDYIFHSERYGINKWELEKIIRSSVNRTKICLLLNITQTKQRGCE